MANMLNHKEMGYSVSSGGKLKVERRGFLSSGEAEETRISAICKSTTTKPDGKKTGDILQIFAG